MTPPDPQSLAPHHRRMGWWLLFAFLALGMILDAFHGLKIGWYLDASNHTRRLMWTLAHAHGALIALVHIAYASHLAGVAHAESSARRLWIASRSLDAAGFVLPGGFVLAGIYAYGADPGVGGFAVPVGGAVLLLAVGLIASTTRR